MPQSKYLTKGLLPQKPGFNPRVTCNRLTMDKVTLLLPLLPILIPTELHTPASSADTEGISEAAVSRNSVAPPCYIYVSTHAHVHTWSNLDIISASITVFAAVSVHLSARCIARNIYEQEHRSQQ